MKGKRKLMVAGISALTLVLMAGCGSKSDPVPAAKEGGQTAAPTKAAGKEIPVGVVYPVSGPNAQVGEETINAWKLVIDQANKSGKLAGTIRLIIEDDRSSPTDGVAAAQKLVTRDKVIAILGPFNSNVAQPISDYTEKAKIPTLVSGASADGLTERGLKYFFRTNGNNAMQSEVFPQWLYKSNTWRKIVIVHQQTDWGNGLQKTTKENFEKLGGQVVESMGYEPNATDFYSLLTKLKGKQFDGVVTAALNAELGTLVRQGSELGIPATKFASYAADIAKLQELAGKAADGVLTANNFDASNPEFPEAKTFVADYNTAYKKLPTLFASQGGASGQMLVAALVKCQCTDAEGLANALRSLKAVSTIYGPLEYDEKGQAHASMIFQKLQDGKLVTVGRS